MHRHADMIVCRCERIRASVVERAITQLDCRDVNEVKKATRAGMGLCQGRVCLRLIELVLRKLVHTEAASIPHHARPPLRPVPLAQLARLAAFFNEPAGTLNADVIWGVSTGARGTPLRHDPE